MNDKWRLQGIEIQRLKKNDEKDINARERNSNWKTR
jgi:hypothetical protein